MGQEGNMRPIYQSCNVGDVMPALDILAISMFLVQMFNWLVHQVHLKLYTSYPWRIQLPLFSQVQPLGTEPRPKMYCIF